MLSSDQGVNKLLVLYFSKWMIFFKPDIKSEALPGLYLFSRETNKLLLGCNLDKLDTPQHTTCILSWTNMYLHLSNYDAAKQWMPGIGTALIKSSSMFVSIRLLLSSCQVFKLMFSMLERVSMLRFGNVVCSSFKYSNEM